MAFIGWKMIETHLNTVKLEKAIKMVPGILKVELADAFDHISLKFLKTFKQMRLQGPPGIKGQPHGIFIRFKRQFFLPIGGLDKMGVEIYSDSKIARMHEEGAVITAEGGRRLAVPFSQEYRPEMYTAGGRLRVMFRRPALMKRVGVIKSGMKEFLAQFKRGTREVKPLFVLKERVTIKPRLGFYRTWTDMRQFHIARLNQAVIKALKKV